jgi:hypothetical protein
MGVKMILTPEPGTGGLPQVPPKIMIYLIFATSIALGIAAYYTSCYETICNVSGLILPLSTTSFTMFAELSRWATS